MIGRVTSFVSFQFDWSEKGLVVGRIYPRMQGSQLKLCAGRTFWLAAYPSQGHENLFDAHTRSFAAPGGVPRRGIYDNMKSAVVKVNKGRGRIVNARFAVMCAYYLFDADFCNVASGWEKGVVEKNVQDGRRRIWIEAPPIGLQGSAVKTAFARHGRWCRLPRCVRRAQAPVPKRSRTAARTRETRERTVPTGTSRYSAASS